MEQPVEQPIPSGTEVIEEKPVTPKSRKRFWLLAGLGGGLLAFGLIVLVTALRFRPSALQPPMTAEDLAQQKYDAQQAENDLNKAAALRNDPLLLRKEDADTSQQLNSMMSQLENNSDTPPVPLTSDKHARAEEEAISHVLRGPGVGQNSTNDPAQLEDYGSRPTGHMGSPVVSDTRGSDQPMFIYSRTFGGAKYVDAPKESSKRESAATIENSQVIGPGRSIASRSIASDAQEKSKGGEQKTTLIYTEFPPVTMFEGEMIDAVLVNRIVADTEPSPVVCQISKDVFDNSRRYVYSRPTRGLWACPRWSTTRARAGCSSLFTG